MGDQKEKRNVTIWTAIGVATPIIIVLVTSIITVSVSLARGEAKDFQQDKEIERLDLHDKEHDRKMESTNDKIFEKIQQILLKLENKQDRP